MENIPVDVEARLIKHFDKQVNWLNSNFEAHVESIKNKIEVDVHLYQKQTDSRFSKVWEAVKELRNKRFEYEARVVATSVFVVFALIGAAWAVAR